MRKMTGTGGENLKDNIYEQIRLTSTMQADILRMLSVKGRLKPWAIYSSLSKKYKTVLTEPIPYSPGLTKNIFYYLQKLKLYGYVDSFLGYFNITEKGRNILKKSEDMLVSDCGSILAERSGKTIEEVRELLLKAAKRIKKEN